MTYILHYAPDNASAIVRVVLEEMGLPYRAVLVDRSVRAQKSPAYLALNPVGVIPTLETPEGPLSETGAILLWLGQRHGRMLPEGGAFLKWLFFTSNTAHADLRMVFYPGQYVGDDPAAQSALHRGVTARMPGHFTLLDRAGVDEGTILAPYVAFLLRWAALYGAGGTEWFDLSDYPALAAMAARLEQRPSVQAVAGAEGLGAHPFTRPEPCQPPEGSAL